MSQKIKKLPLKRNATGQAILLTTLALMALGVVMVHSALASVARPGAWYARVDVRHTAFAVLAFTLLLILWRIDYHVLNWGKALPWLPAAALVASLILAALVFHPALGHEVGGKYRWIRIGPDKYSIGLQPSELVKLSLVVFLAAWLTRESVDVRRMRRAFLPAGAIIAVCTLLVMTQDFGTAILIGVSSVVTLLLAGVPVWHVLLMVPPAGAAFWAFVVQNPARWQRIAAMFDPWSQSNPSAFQARQSLMAILSGGWWGRGPGNGFRKLGYLPEDSTDFIFAVYCEEWGFVGAMLLLGLIFLWIFSVRRAALRGPDRLGCVLAGSLGFVIAFQAVLHVAVDLVAAPPTGMGLPFVSAGGTALVNLAAATAVIVSVSARSRASDIALRDRENAASVSAAEAA
ncbi:MAG: FtsW/RodA/SpoVE family cell cycle protein [Phycisphaerae bacterium]